MPGELEICIVGLAVPFRFPLPERHMFEKAEERDGDCACCGKGFVGSDATKGGREVHGLVVESDCC